jgi:hypothetical protein
MRNWLHVLRIGLPLLLSAVILSSCTVSPYPAYYDGTVVVRPYPYHYYCCYGGYYHGYYHGYGHGWGRR